MKYIFFILALFVSIPCFAGPGWYDKPDCTGTIYTKLKPVGGSTDGVDPIWHCPTGTGNSSILQATNTFSICFDPDTSGAAGAARVYIRQCVSNVASANSCQHLTVDADNDGILDDFTLNGDNGAVSGVQNYCRYDLPPGFYYIETSVGPAGGETPKVKAQVTR